LHYPTGDDAIMIRSMGQLRYIILIFSSVLFGCNLSAPQAVPPTDTPAYLPSIRLSQAEVTIMPTVIREIPTSTPPPATAPPPTATQPAYTCNLPDEQVMIQHNITAELDFSTKQISVDQVTRYANQTGETLNTIVLDVQTNNWQNAFQLDVLRWQNIELEYTLSNNTLSVNLPQPLEPGCEIVLQLAFQVRPPQVAAGSQAYRGFFGYSARQLNLALWLPTVAPFSGGQWWIHDPILIGEQIVLEQANWDVTFNVTNASAPLILAAPGNVETLAENRWRIVKRDSRDLTLSLSADFIVNRRQTPSGVIVEAYTFPDAVGQVEGAAVNGAAHMLDSAYKSVLAFEKVFGPYPYQRMLVVQGDFPDGMEFSGLVFVSTAWFYYFDGTPTNYLTIITAHEVAHQWWYAQVGNDSAMAPWLDESLATYSEYIFYEEFYPELKDWWWGFRIATFNPQGNVDGTVYEYSTARQYINATYLRGAQMLHNLREDMGTEAFFDLLFQYAQQGDGAIVTPEFFWSLLSEEQLRQTADTRSSFFRDPGYIPEMDEE